MTVCIQLDEKEEKRWEMHNKKILIQTYQRRGKKNNLIFKVQVECVITILLVDSPNLQEVVIFSPIVYTRKIFGDFAS